VTPNALRATRVALGLTQRQLALVLGVHANTVACWERGDKPIGNPTMVAATLRDVEARRKPA
jgi:transcriptional regulator with XRE-family HTH domain